MAGNGHKEADVWFIFGWDGNALRAIIRTMSQGMYTKNMGAIGIWNLFDDRKTRVCAISIIVQTTQYCPPITYR